MSSAARNSVAAAFIANGFGFATFFSRVPDVRSELSLDNGALGLLLLSASAGSIVALPLSGRLIERFGGSAVVRAGGIACALALLVIALGAGTWGQAPVAAVGLLVYGVGTATWDVAMNVEAAAVEQRFGRTMMPRFHAGWSLGSIIGAAVAVPINALDLPLVIHFGVAGVLLAVANQLGNSGQNVFAVVLMAASIGYAAMIVRQPAA